MVRLEQAEEFDEADRVSVGSVVYSYYTCHIV